ncbi:hypothetical protein ACTFIW_000861 [Dictyostelium discoideum]
MKNTEIVPYGSDMTSKQRSLYMRNNKITGFFLLSFSYVAYLMKDASPFPVVVKILFFAKLTIYCENDVQEGEKQKKEKVNPYCRSTPNKLKTNSSENFKTVKTILTEAFYVNPNSFLLLLIKPIFKKYMSPEE